MKWSRGGRSERQDKRFEREQEEKQNLPEAAQSGTGHKTTEPSRSSPKWHWTQNNRTFQKQPKVALDTEQQNLPEAAQSGTGHRTTEPEHEESKCGGREQKDPKTELHPHQRKRKT